MRAFALWTALLCGCVDPIDDEGQRPTVPEGHPCPTLALAPEESSLWTANRDSGEPVPLALLPPLEEGEDATISQGHHSDSTHQGQDAWAWDLDVAFGTPVHAAAAGVVVGIREDSDLFGEGPEMADKANFVIVDHGGGLYTAYTHLAKDSVDASPGDPVEAGDILAITGQSGQMTGPHLHFHLENAFSESLPARFVDRGGETGCARDPGKGASLRRPVGARSLWVGAKEVSPLPTDTFARSGVETVEGLPGRLARRSQPFLVEGLVEAGATEAWLLVLPVDGGDVLQAFAFPVQDGGFSGKIQLDVPVGPTGWAMVATAGEDPVVERSVRVWVLE